MTRPVESCLWFFAEHGQQLSESHRFHHPVKRAEAAEHICDWYGWDRLPRGSELWPVTQPWWR